MSATPMALQSFGSSCQSQIFNSHSFLILLKAAKGRLPVLKRTNGHFHLIHAGDQKAARSQERIHEAGLLSFVNRFFKVSFNSFRGNQAY
jgi:hypothetical protein